MIVDFKSTHTEPHAFKAGVSSVLLFTPSEVMEKIALFLSSDINLLLRIVNFSKLTAIVLRFF
mgnify:CR=1 FL=1